MWTTMDANEDKPPLPDHYPTVRGTLRLLAGKYLRSLDATVRALGAVLICAILFFLASLPLYLAVAQALTGG